MSEPFDIAIDGAQAFRFERGPGTTAYVAPDAAPDIEGHVFELPDGRSVKQVQASRFESVLALSTWWLSDDGPAELDRTDEVVGYLAPNADTPLVQLRLMPPPPGAWPQFPTVLAGDSLPAGHGSVRDRVRAGILAHAPEGWRTLALECRATARRMELSATVTLADGVARGWSPPAMVSQWLHRLRVREYRSTIGVWFTARFEFSSDGTSTQHFDIEGKPAWQVPQSFRDEQDHYADELRLLPRRPEAVFPWMYEAAAKVQQRGRADALAHPGRAAEDAGPEIVRLFDVLEDGRPTWYRPMVGGREVTAIRLYLENAPLVLSSRGLTADMLSDDDEQVVPMGYHTDGRFVWSSAAAYYLWKHSVPPPLPLVDHIRENRYRLPDEVPAIVKGRAAALAMGRPYLAAQEATALEAALEPVRDILRAYRTSPRFYRLDGHQDQSWCLVRDGDWYRVYWAEGEQERSAARFGDVRDAAAYLAGRLVLDRDRLRYEVDEEIPWWQSPYQVLSEADPALAEFTGVALAGTVDLEVDRYGTPDGNLVFAADTPFEQRGLPADHADREYHRYRLPGRWSVMTAVSPAGGRAYLLPLPIGDYVASGQAQEVTPAAGHPGLPPITDALRAEARRNPGGWVWCADPDVDPRHIEGVPDFALLGAYRVDPDGELTGETFLNPEYRPSPRRLGFPEPQSDFELVLGFVAAGWLPQERVIAAALDAQFIVESDGAGGLRIGVDGQGRRFLPVYSSPGYVPADAATPMQASGRALLPALAGVTLVVNPGGAVGTELPGDDLVAAG
ncbi:hypothetical protein FHS29_002578 [Saccharothrix tamanrassetensis]|uniref:SseB protein N-terminal domain-containing protein n=1 Tax=Saccharothrix tamanrassetensis TaxID=1051531 RepID=A0A841CIP2_9PSEU|nr:type VII secretion system-associated protein [Saccharothrix tamanrassetensis]MBB5955997.1 hypothetical protein [Saccharothrix tamanrassetensis]